ncbi:L-amino acid N-acyltransferase YncA [Alkalibacillus filiformis]|uniref:L-amino acid N-acyltransferase YncA n=1 Tax=Alkalibacillus filiformis TaxID=200990 RepID=A0ABU0DTG7_9BACI|nr:GNAT family N-acetyltransferase [Alkalibacillus filiformis]MDQ0351650.1 L-amino acid N-acyltransferase YncA [Alkalibacillus filiformis]
MVKVRQATVFDAEQIANVHDDTWKLTYEPIIQQDDLQQVTSFENRKIMWETTLRSSSHHVFVVESNEGEIAGFISGGKSRTEHTQLDGEIYDIYILPSHQRKGFGQKLLYTFIQECEELGYQSLLVWILTDNPYGQFYVRLGARKIEADNVTIGKGTYEETAYGWEDLEQLKGALASSQVQ